MTMTRALRAELVKAATLPATWVAMTIAVLGPLAITVLNARGVRAALDSGRLESVGYTSPVEAALSAVPLGTVGAVIIGVTAISSEYATAGADVGGGRQIHATLTAAPHRSTVLMAKTGAVMLGALAAAALAIPASLGAAHWIIGDTGAADGLPEMIARGAGAGLYWVLTAVIALAITTATRSGIVPLIVLIANSTVVSVPILLTRLTDLAYYSPDLAGMSLFAGEESWAMASEALDPLTGGLVMAAWAVALLVLGGILFTRRDA